MSDISIRTARQEDADAISYVHVESWKTAYKGIVPDDFLNKLNLDSRIEYWKRTLKTNTGNIIVAEVKNTIVGFAYVGPPREKNAYASELYAIYILKEYRRMNIGKKLMSAIAEYLLSCELASMYLWVLADNPSKTFYEKTGGQKFEEKEISIGGQILKEDGYGWGNVRDFLFL